MKETWFLANDRLFPSGIADPVAIRVACGFRQKTIARALGVPPSTLSFWERGLATPRRGGQGPAYARYARVIAGLARHLEIAEGDTD